MDLLAELGNSRLYNLHSHTQFCDGHAPMEEFAAAAVAAGFSHYGFSPHSPIPDYISSPCNMSREDVPKFFAEVERLRQLYKDSSTKFLRSMEVDYLSRDWSAANDYFQSLPLDYRISSVHFIPSDSGYIDIDGNEQRFIRNMKQHFHQDIEHVVGTYFNQTFDMITAGGFDIIGHMDKIGLNASYFEPRITQSRLYRESIRDLIDRVISSGIIVEINTKSWVKHGKLFPDPEIIKVLKSEGVGFVVNSDAHDPALINASRDLGLSLLSD